MMKAGGMTLTSHNQHTHTQCVLVCRAVICDDDSWRNDSYISQPTHTHSVCRLASKGM